MTMPIYLYGTKVWSQPAKKVTKFDEKLVGLIKEMFETMYQADGIGLAANQVGLPLSLAVIDLSAVEGYQDEKPLVVINPELLEADGEYVMEEGCLSVPGIREEVVRPDRIFVRFIDGNFREIEREFSGMWARVFQHEYDHLNLKFFVDRLNGVKKQLLKPKLAKVKRGEFKTNYPSVSAKEEQ
jgi:peptide deformylase